VKAIRGSFLKTINTKYSAMGALFVSYAHSDPPVFNGEVVKKERLEDIPPQGCCSRTPKFDALVEIRKDDGHIEKILGPPSDQVWALIQVGGYYRFKGLDEATEIPRPS